MNHLAEIESLLYVAGDEGITLQHIARLIMLDEAAVRQLLTKLAKRYQVRRGCSTTVTNEISKTLSGG